MPDSHIIILGCVGDLAGDSTTGKAAELRNAIVAADELLKETVNEPLHELLETLEPIVCAMASDAAQRTEDLNALM